MSSDRRFDDAEVERLFARAAEMEAERDATPPMGISRARAPRREGMTLAEVQAIGAEAGLEPASLARAAAELVAPKSAPEPRQRMFGLPIGVSHELLLDEPVSEEEWIELVGELRYVFDAPGEMQQQGPFREWANGQLRASLEPAGNKHRLRLRTKKSGATEALLMGAAMPAFGAIIGLAGALAGKPKAFVVFGILAGVGLLIGGATAIDLRRWSRTRDYQMREILERFAARRAARALGADPDALETDALPPSADGTTPDGDASGAA